MQTNRGTFQWSARSIFQCEEQALPFRKQKNKAREGRATTRPRLYVSSEGLRSPVLVPRNCGIRDSIRVSNLIHGMSLVLEEDGGVLVREILEQGPIHVFEVFVIPAETVEFILIHVN